jgi:hypothetical protein
MYTKGESVEQDFKETVKWWRKAAEQGYATAQYNLGMMYATGEGVPQDYKEAIKWYRKSAEQGVPYAQYNLGWMYKRGEGVMEDYVTAYAWFNIAAANGHYTAKPTKVIVAKEMTADQIAKAEELVKEMVKKNPKLLQKKE